MKILYFLAHPAAIGGANKVLLVQAHLMQNIGHTVWIVLQDEVNNKHIMEQEMLCKSLCLPFISLQFSVATSIEDIDFLSSCEDLPDIEEIINNFRPDILHSVQINISVEILARKNNIPHIMNVYPICDGMFNIKWKDILPHFHSCDSILYCNKWHSGLGIISECIRVAYERNVEDKIEDNKQFGQDSIIELINIALFTKYKRQLEILKFIKIAKSKSYNLHITFVGDYKNAYGQACISFVKEHNLEKEVEFAGFVFDVENYIRKADVMIHASITESYPGVVVEALANKLPIIVTPVGGIPELIQNEINGFLTTAYDDKSIFDCFEKYVKYRKSGKIQAIIEAGYRTYVENHSYDVIANKINNYYRKVLKEYRANYGSYEIIPRVEEEVKKYCNKIQIEKYDYETKKRVWFLFHINKIIEEQSYKNAIIWGAGIGGSIALSMCRALNLDVLYFVDSYKSGYKENIKILSPGKDELIQADVVFVAMADVDGCNESMCILNKIGKIRNKNYFFVWNNPCLSSRCEE